ncbi:MAG: cytochrome C oxidase subunit IV family protein [Rhodocyclaceae bacterium]|nr:cytochrome C oxidase subunit IV family protein [Rhodocyclaceae bacterium]
MHHIPTTFRLTAVWLFLLVATGVTWHLGESGPEGGMTIAFAILAIAFFKCRFVAWDFMGLAHANLFWRALMLGWLVFVLSLIAIAYRMGIHQ